MKNIVAVVMLVSAGFLLGADDIEVKTHDTTHYLDRYTTNLKNPEFNRLCVGCLCAVYKREERIPAWLALDVIKKYKLPGCNVVPALPSRDSLTWKISNDGVERVLRHLVTEETMPFILAERSISTWCSLAGWAAAHMPSIASTARQSQLDALRSEIMKEYKSCATHKSDKYKETDGDDSFLPLLSQ